MYRSIVYCLANQSVICRNLACRVRRFLIWITNTIREEVGVPTNTVTAWTEMIGNLLNKSNNLQLTTNQLRGRLSLFVNLHDMLPNPLQQRKLKRFKTRNVSIQTW